MGQPPKMKSNHPPALDTDNLFLSVNTKSPTTGSHALVRGGGRICFTCPLFAPAPSHELHALASSSPPSKGKPVASAAL